MVLRYDPETHEVVICPVWGQRSDGIPSIRVRPTLQVQIGRELFTPQQRILSGVENFAVTVEFRSRHPWRLLSSHGSSAGDISASIRPRETSSAVGRWCHCVRQIAPGSEIGRVSGFAFRCWFHRWVPDQVLAGGRPPTGLRHLGVARRVGGRRGSMGQPVVLTSLPSADTTHQTVFTPWPLTSPGALSGVK